MTLVRWQPFRSLARTNARDLLDEVFSNVFEPASKDSTWYPRVDVRDDGESINLYAELPGMKQDDFKVTYENNVLTLSGERKAEERKDENCYYCVERQYGRFARSFKMPAEVDGEKITADYKDGVLHLNLPKQEAKKPREIKIS